MKYSVEAREICGGTVSLPSSKSISNRLLLIKALCNNELEVSNLSDSDDTRVVVAALASDLSHVDIGAAGTSMRFLTAFLAQKAGKHVITGSERMKQRPISVLVDALQQLGADIQYIENEGFPPLAINGKRLTGSNITLPGNVSSQYISALMMIAPTVSGGLTITLTGKIISRPYIDMTLSLMRRFGIDGKWSAGNAISIPEGRYVARATGVESDWSAASYWYSIAALSAGKEFKLTGLERNSLQGDSAVADIAARLGVTTEFVADGVVVRAQAAPPAHFEYDFTNQPDLAQTFVVLCCVLGVTFRFTGLESLKIKETDRIGALVAECEKLGYTLETDNVGTLSYSGVKASPSAEAIKTYKDHRMAMAFAPAALRMGRLVIDDPMVVTKSYPTFWENLSGVGFEVKEIE